MADAERAWEQVNCSAIYAGHADRLASVGWSQGWADGASMKDPILASLDLDFTYRHYYGPPARLAAELKDVDLRGLGKPLILGECGAKDHPTFKAAGPWGMDDDEDSYDARFLYLGHHALGLGAAVVSSWHWRERLRRGPSVVCRPNGWTCCIVSRPKPPGLTAWPSYRRIFLEGDG